MSTNTFVAEVAIDQDRLSPSDVWRCVSNRTKLSGVAHVRRRYWRDPELAIDRAFSNHIPTPPEQFGESVFWQFDVGLTPDCFAEIGPRFARVESLLVGNVLHIPGGDDAWLRALTEAFLADIRIRSVVSLAQDGDYLWVYGRRDIAEFDRRRPNPSL